MMRICKMLLLGFLLTAAASASAGSFRLKTGKAVGEKLSIAVNAGIPLTLTWGDGTTEESLSTGTLQEFEVKAEVLTVSSEKSITSLFLADNELTDLVLNNVASTLRRLYCSGNKLKSLNLTACTELVSLDCQGNQLETLSIGSALIEDLNIADNKLSTNGLRSGANVTSLVCANNKLTSIAYLSSMTGLKTLFCQGNQLSSLPASKCTELQRLLAFDNKLKTLNTPVLVNLKEIWLGGNQLETLDLSAVEAIEGVSVPGNALNLISWNRATTSRNALKYVDLSDNALFFNSFPGIYNPTQGAYTVDGYIGSQEPYQLFSDMDVNQRSDAVQMLLGRNGWNSSISTEISLADQNGQTLVAGEDYTYATYRITFMKPFTGVVVTATSRNYPDVTLTSKPFTVTDPTGIEGIGTSAEERTDGPIYDLQGRRVSATGISGRQLSKGLYIVGGKKVVIR